MSVETVNISIKSLDPTARVRSPAEKGAPQKDKADVKAEKAPDVSRVSGTGANAQKDLVSIHGVDLQFTVDKPTGQLMVTVRNKSTGEVIREIPSSEVLKLAASIDEMIGIMFDQRC